MLGVGWMGWMGGLGGWGEWGEGVGEFHREKDKNLLTLPL